MRTLTLNYTDATADFTFDLPFGVYELAIMIYKTVDFAASSGSVVIGDVTPYLNDAQTLVADSPFALYDANDSYLTALVTTITVATGSTAVNRYLTLPGLFGSITSLPVFDHGPFVIGHGLRISWTNTLGTGTAGQLVAELLAAKIA